MKKLYKSVVIILACAMVLMMAACGRKSYSSLEEWYSDNPTYEKTLQTMLSLQKMESLSMKFSIEENNLVYRYTYNYQVFGLDSLTDAYIRKTIYDGIEAQNSSFTQTIDNIAKESGIDADSLAVQLEYYNPGETTPGYTHTITKLDSFSKDYTPSSKEYASLEDWVLDYPDFITSLTDTEGNTVETAVEGNDIIYRYKYNEQIFGLNAETDELIGQTLDQNIEAQRSIYTQVIDAVSTTSEIDASEINIRIEAYNPGESTPHYTQYFTK